jgi:GntR family transcriptional regulator
MADPRWRQIAEDLRLKIESGKLGRDGQPLPTELELQEQYSASRNTVRDAVKWLAARDLVYTRSGQGTFVTRKRVPFVTRLGGDPKVGRAEISALKVAVGDESRTPRDKPPRLEILQAAGLAREELRLPDDAEVISRHQQQLIDDDPYSLQTTFYPMSLVDAGAHRLIRAEDIKDGAVAYIAAAAGIRQAGWRDRITIRAPDANEATFFGLPDDGRVAIVQIVRTGFDEDGQPFRVTVTTYPADRNQFVVEEGRVPESTSHPGQHEPR